MAALPHEALELGMAGWEKVMADFRAEAHYAKFMGVYRKVL